MINENEILSFFCNLLNYQGRLLHLIGYAEGLLVLGRRQTTG